jgi:hypothetical protein
MFWFDRYFNGTNSSKTSHLVPLLFSLITFNSIQFKSILSLSLSLSLSLVSALYAIKTITIKKWGGDGVGGRE